MKELGDVHIVLRIINTVIHHSKIRDFDYITHPAVFLVEATVSVLLWSVVSRCEAAIVIEPAIILKSASWSEVPMILGCPEISIIPACVPVEWDIHCVSLLHTMLPVVGRIIGVTGWPWGSSIHRKTNYFDRIERADDSI